jgi:undecaprenyl-diphosphatase
VTVLDARAQDRARRAFGITMAVAWPLFLALTIIVVSHPAGTTLDLWLAPDAFDAAATHPLIDGVGKVLDVVGGNVSCIVIVCGVAVTLAARRRRALAAYVLASALGGVLLSSLVKALVDRPRPPTVGLLLQEVTWSYPSGHATAGITVFVALGLVSLVVLRDPWRWWVAVPLFVLGPLEGVSRVVMGVHWPTDVLGGWALGSAWTATAALALLLVQRSRGR